MASQAQSGKLVVLKIELDTPGTFEPILTAKNNTFSINNTPVDVTTKLDAGWTALLSGGGTKTLETSVSGTFCQQDTDKKLIQLSVSGNEFEAELSVGRIGKFAGTFVCTKVTIGGEHNGAITYDVSLQSSGEMIFTPAP